MSASFISPPLTLTEIPQPQTLALGVLASGSGSNFEAIAATIAQQRLNAQIRVLIYNQPAALVQTKAQA